MANFKGTRGKWDWYYDKYDDCYQVTAGKIVAMTFYDSDEDKANALLISKAPEMLEMLEYLVENDYIANLENVQKVKQLIKEATEL